jgi:hypothetical protein
MRCIKAEYPLISIIYRMTVYQFCFTLEHHFIGFVLPVSSRLENPVKHMITAYCSSNLVLTSCQPTAYIFYMLQGTGTNSQLLGQEAD